MSDCPTALLHRWENWSWKVLLRGWENWGDGERKTSSCRGEKREVMESGRVGASGGEDSEEGGDAYIMEGGVCNI